MRDTIIHGHTLGLIGLGFWGEKILRTSLDMGIHIIGTDLDPKRQLSIKRLYPLAQIARTPENIFSDQSISACIIATPPDTHFSLAASALTSGKDVLVEKPMTQNVAEAKKLIRLSHARPSILMVDHIYLFSPIIHAIKSLMQKNTIGKIEQIISIRDTGRRHPKSSVLWDLAPHDISIASFLLDALPLRGRAMATSVFHTERTEDAMYQLLYPNRTTLQGIVRWNTPVKKRSMEIIGESGALSVEWDSGKETYTRFACITQKGQRTYRKQKTVTIKDTQEPMSLMLEHFLTCIHTRRSPVTDGNHALEVIRAVTALETSVRRAGAFVTI